MFTLFLPLRAKNSSCMFLTGLLEFNRGSAHVVTFLEQTQVQP